MEILWLAIGLLLGGMASGVVYAVLFHGKVAQLHKHVEETLDFAYNRGYDTGWNMALDAPTDSEENIEQYYQKEGDIIEP